MFTASRARESVILPQELVPWGPARASLLDQLGNELAPPVQVDIGSGSNDFAFAMSFHPNFGDFLPVNFYGVRFDFTAPNAPDSTITRQFLAARCLKRLLWNWNSPRYCLYAVALAVQSGSAARRYSLQA